MAKHIEFQLDGSSVSGKTKVWCVRSKYDHKPVLGYVQWFARWRKYSFFPQPNTIYEQVCLRDIADFCENATAEQRGRNSRRTL